MWVDIPNKYFVSILTNIGHSLYYESFMLWKFHDWKWYFRHENECLPNYIYGWELPVPSRPISSNIHACEHVIQINPYAAGGWFDHYKMMHKTEKWLKPWHVVFIWECSTRAFQWLPTWQGLDGFEKSLYSCALDKGSLSNGRVNLMSRYSSLHFPTAWHWRQSVTVESL